MRYGIRDFLLVMSVVFSGLAISSTSVRADDPPTAADTAPVSAAETPAAGTVQPEKAGDSTEKTAEQPGKAPSGDGADTAKTPEPAKTEPGTGEGAKAEHGQTAPGADAKADAGDSSDPVEEASIVHGDATHDVHAAGAHATDDHAADHDPYDRSHVNATAAIEDPSQIRSDLAIWTMVVFLCLLALLAKFAWGPIMEGLERREASIAAAIDEAEQAAAKGAEQLKLYEAKLAAAADETREILARARQAAEVTGERIVAEAQEAAARERDKAVADIFAAKNSALAEITERSVDLAVSMAGRMIQRQMTPDDRAGLIREALDQLPNQN